MTDSAAPEQPVDPATAHDPVEEAATNAIAQTLVEPSEPIHDTVAENHGSLVAQASIEPPAAEVTHEPTEAEAADLGRPEGAAVESLIVTAVDLFPSEHATVVVSLGDGHYTFTTGEAIHAFVDDLLAAGRAAFGATHTGLYREQPQPPEVPVGLRDPESK